MLFFLSKFFSLFPLFLLLLLYFSTCHSLRLRGAHLVALYALVVAILPEILSAFKLCTPLYVSLVWLGGILPASIYLYASGKIKPEFSLNEIHLEKENRPAWLVIATVSLILFITAFVLSRNTDSLVGHIPRVYHWLQNGSVELYYAQDIRQISQATLSGYFLLPNIAIGGNHDTSGLLQWACYIITIISVARSTRLITNSDAAATWAALFIATFPIVVLQARTTQIDVVSMCFVCLVAECALRLLHHSSTRENFERNDLYALPILGGLVVATKGLGLLFALPLSMIAFLAIRKQMTLRIFLILGIATAVASFSFLPFHIRQYLTFGTFTGPFAALVKPDVFYWQAPLFFIPVYVLDSLASYLSADQLHSILNNIGSLLALDPSSVKAITRDYNLRSNFMNEDNLTYGVTFLLFFPVVVYTLIKGNNSLRAIAISLIIGWCLFCFIIKWYPTNTRLLCPLYGLLAIITGFAFSNWFTSTISRMLLVVYHGVLGISVAILSAYTPTVSLNPHQLPWKDQSRLQQMSTISFNKVAAEIDRLKPRKILLAMTFGEEAAVWYILNKIYGRQMPEVRALFSSHEIMFDSSSKKLLPGYVKDADIRSYDMIIMRPRGPWTPTKQSRIDQFKPSHSKEHWKELFTITKEQDRKN